MTTQSRVADRRASPTLLLEFHHPKQVSLSRVCPDGDDHEGQKVAFLETARDSLKTRRKKKHFLPSPAAIQALHWRLQACPLLAITGNDIYLMTITVTVIPLSPGALTAPCSPDFAEEQIGFQVVNNLLQVMGAST